MPTLYEQIAEEAKTLGEEVNLKLGDDDAQDDNTANARRPVRGQSGHDEGERPGDEHAEDEPSARPGSHRGADEDAPRDESGTPPGDAAASHESGGGTQKDAQPSQEDGQELLEKPLTNADWAKQRRELRELKAKLAKLESERIVPVTPAKEQATKPALETKPEPAKEPDKNTNYQAWLEWKLQQQDTTLKEQSDLIKEYKDWRAEQTKEREQEKLLTSAVNEFQRIENGYKKQNPDYSNAMDFARAKYTDAIRIMYPQMNEEQVDAAIDQQILRFASDCAARGLNPAEELYDMAIERFGYAKQEAKAEVEQPAKPAPKERPNLRMISNNKRKSASPLSGGGQGGGIPLTLEVADDMTIGEFSRLSPDQIRALEEIS